MNLETINKWLDEEYGYSYTKLEELHDFYFEKYCDLKQENKQLNNNWNELKEYMIKEQTIIVIENTDEDEFAYTDLLNKMQEIEGSDE